MQRTDGRCCPRIRSVPGPAVAYRLHPAAAFAFTRATERPATTPVKPRRKVRAYIENLCPRTRTVNAMEQATPTAIAINRDVRRIRPNNARQGYARLRTGTLKSAGFFLAPAR